jgi:prepilin-type N-terminal cleavage/methylation domain-containing protein
MVRQKGFTLIELLVVLTTMTLLVVMLLPAIAGTRQNSQVIGCLANQKRLAATWIMYARDNNDVLVPNRGLAGQSPVTVNPLTNPDLKPGGQYAQWCPGNMQTLQLALYYDQWIKAGLLYPYINNVNVYHCPADQNRIPHGIASPFRKPASRTYSMNCWAQPMDGPGYTTMTWNGLTGYVAYTKLSTMTRPGPGKTWVFIEENPYSIDDAFFVLDPGIKVAWSAAPAVLHGNSSVLAFADGHSDAHRWTDANMIHGTDFGANGANVPVDPNSQDLAWLLSATTVHQ